MCAKIKHQIIIPIVGLLLTLSPIYAGDIHHAVEKNDIQLVLNLLENTADKINTRDDRGKTSIGIACEQGYNEIIDSLIARGADINLPDNEKRSPLHIAAAKGYKNIARALLKHGTTTINDTSLSQRGGLLGGWTPLHEACLNGHPEVVTLLLDNGADIEARDGVKRTPLILTAESNNLSVAEILIEKGADINAVAIRGYTALLWGVRNQFEEYVDLLITHKPEIEKDALTQAYQMAVVSGMEQLYYYTLDLGFNIKEMIQRDPGLIFPAAAGGSKEIVKSLVESGFEPSQKDEAGWTPLHYAASEGHTEIAKYLIETGVDKNARNMRGESAFNLASLKGFNKTADDLRTIGVDPSLPIFPVVEGPYMGQKPPGQKPEIFFPGVVSGHDRAHSSITFSPDGSEAYWTEMIPPEGRVAFMQIVSGKWTYPVNAPIDRDPTFSPDGNRLFFIKTRPFKDGEVPGGDPDVKEEYWYIQKTDTGWSEPISAGDNVNAIGVHWPCSIDKDGNLYFSEFSDNMYYSKFINGVYEEPIRLTKYFNNESLIGRSPCISPGGDYLLFSKDDALHISFKTADNNWSDGINLGNEINASHVNGSPRITADNKYMFFLSAGQGRPWGIYWVTIDFIDRLKTEHLSQ